MPKWSGEGVLIPGSHCPRDNEPLEYNGNYWCSNPSCDYTMPERMTAADKRAFNVAYVLLMKQRGKEPLASALYREVM